VRITAHVADALFEPRAAQQRVAGRQFDAVATRNRILLEVIDRYFALAGAEAGLRAIRQTEDDQQKVVKVTADFAATGQGRDGDAQRMRADALLLHTAAVRAEEDVAAAAAELSRLLDLDPSVRLHTPDAPLPLVQFFGPREDVEALVQTAVANRPELGARSADVAAAQTHLRQEQWRPFVPFLSVGYSAGDFGGGGNQTDTNFGHFSSRTDFDALAVWSLENFGLGNLAVQRQRGAQVGQALAERVRALDEIRREVVEAYAATQAGRRDLDLARRRVETAAEAFELDLVRARNLKGLPIETLDSLRLLEAARREEVRAAFAYNQAQFRLFVALGTPPTVAVAAFQTPP
jgi:outer membrane protein TolC